MKSTSHSPWGIISLLGIVFLLVAPVRAFAVEATQPAEANTVIRGLVLDEHTSRYLEGAEVYIDGTKISTFTNRDGKFVLRDVPAGTEKIVVVYPGLQRQDVVLGDRSAEEIVVALRSDGDKDVTVLQSFEVTGTKEGMAQATALQKSANEIKLVAAADQFGDINNGNVAEYLKFLPGIGVDYAADDARSLSLRGLNPSLTKVTSDNSPIANASGGFMDRRFEFETISISNIEMVEVFKTLTPDQPATNTGGSVNLVTKNAFNGADSLSRFRTYLSVPSANLSAMNGLSPRSNETTLAIRPNIELDLVKRVRPNLGVYLGFRDYQSLNSSYRSQYGYSYNPAQGGLPTDPAPNLWRVDLGNSISIRRSASARIDWKLTPRTILTASGSWSLFQYDPFSGRQVDFLMNFRPALSSTQAPAHTLSTGSTSTVIDPATSRSTGYIDSRVFVRKKTGETYTSGLSIKHEFLNDAVLDANVYWSNAKVQYRDIEDSHFAQADYRLSQVFMTMNDLEAAVPTLTLNQYTPAGNPINLGTLEQYRVLKYYSFRQQGGEERSGATVNFSLPFRASRFPVIFKTGLSIDNRDRTLNRTYRRTLPATTVPAGAGMTAIYDRTWSAAALPFGVSDRGAWIDLSRSYDLYGHLAMESYNQDYDAVYDETGHAAYGRLDVKLHEDLLLVAGVRYEDLSSDNLNRLSAATGRFESDGLYGSLNLKYTPHRNHVFRAAIAQSVGLPNYSDLLPSSFLITDPNESATGRGRINVTNPSLEPYNVMNYDLGYEFYFGGAGRAGVSLFRKSFANYIVSGTETLTPQLAASLGLDPDQLSGSLGEYDVVSRFNIPDKGYYSGVELMYAKTFTALPVPFNTLGIQLSATFIDVEPIETDRVLVADNAAQNRALVEQVRLALDREAVKRTGSVVLNWKYAGFTALLSANHSGRALKSVTRNEVKYSDLAMDYMNERVSIEPRTVVDARLEYRFGRLVPYVQVRNVFNAPIKYTSNGHLLHKTDYLGPRYEVGIRGWW
jgi:TonB-dependent receptor